MRRPVPKCFFYSAGELLAHDLLEHDARATKRPRIRGVFIAPRGAAAGIYQEGMLARKVEGIRAQP